MNGYLVTFKYRKQKIEIFVYAKDKAEAYSKAKEELLHNVEFVGDVI